MVIARYNSKLFTLYKSGVGHCIREVKWPDFVSQAQSPVATLRAIVMLRYVLLL